VNHCAEISFMKCSSVKLAHSFVLRNMITDRVSRNGKTIGLVLSVSFRLSDFNFWTAWLISTLYFACVRITIIAHWGLKMKVIKTRGSDPSRTHHFFHLRAWIGVFKPKAQNLMSTAATEHGQAWGEARQPVGTPGSSTRWMGVGVASRG